MNIKDQSVLVTGAASGLGLASAEHFARAGARVTIVDLPGSKGAEVAANLNAVFAPADVTDAQQVAEAIELAHAAAPLRAVVHCAGRGASLRILDRDGAPADMGVFEGVVRTNLFGTFNVLRLAAARMATNEPLDGDRGIILLTASIAAFEGQIGQIPYASSKAGIVGMTLVAARDLANRLIRVCSIAPGIFDTAILDRLGDEVKEKLGAAVPHPSRLGRASEFAALAGHLVENSMMNGETIRIDGAVRMGPR